MKIQLELKAGNLHREPTLSDFDKNIAALRRAITGKKTAVDDILLLDTISILEGIKQAMLNPQRQIFPGISDWDSK